MAVDWAAHRMHRQQVIQAEGQYVCLLDRNWEPVMDIGDWISADWGGEFENTGSMTMVFSGFLNAPNGEVVGNPVTEFLISAGVEDFSDASSLNELFHSAFHVMVERPAGDRVARRVYRILGIEPEGGRIWPNKVTVTGVDMVEHLKHLPLWADPSNRGKVIQLQFSDIQSGSVEEVSRKLVGRNLIGYQQPSMLSQAFDGKLGSWSMTDDYTNPDRWKVCEPDLHSVICAPVSSGMKSEFCVVEARWDNAWDLLKASWEAGGVMPIVTLWLPGDPQPFPEHTTLRLPTAIIDFKPRATVSGAVAIIGQAWNSLMRKIADDGISSAIDFASQEIPGMDGRKPWVVYDFEDAPKVSIRKSFDHTVLVGSKSSKTVNTLIQSGLKAAFAAIVAGIPGLGPAASELIKGGGDAIAKLSADRFLNLNEYTDEQRKKYHGRSGYISVMKAGQANTMESLQKAWQAKEETNGGLSVEFKVDSVEPYVPHRDFEIGDTIGFTAWGQVWAAYVSAITWSSSPDEPVGFDVKLGDINALKDVDALMHDSIESIRSAFSRLETFVPT